MLGGLRSWSVCCVQCLEWDAYCWFCHMEGDSSDCCCELCPRLYHRKCLGMKVIVDSWICPECQVCCQSRDGWCVSCRLKFVFHHTTACYDVVCSWFAIACLDDHGSREHWHTHENADWCWHAVYFAEICYPAYEISSGFFVSYLLFSYHWVVVMSEIWFLWCKRHCSG